MHKVIKKTPVVKEKIKAKKRVEKVSIEQKLAGIAQGLRKGSMLSRKNIKANQEAIIALLEESELDAIDKAKFIRTIKNIPTAW